jgi:hypothetical protein
VSGDRHLLFNCGRYYFNFWSTTRNGGGGTTLGYKYGWAQGHDQPGNYEDLLKEIMFCNPYHTKSHVYKGQLHFHSTESDGTASPFEIVNAYRKAGYDFVCLTDHDKVTVNPNINGMEFISGCEESGELVGTSPTHIGRIGSFSQTDILDAQTIINDVISEGSLACLNHPHWTGLTGEDCLNLVGVHLIEIGNANVELPISGAQDEPGSSEPLWDTLLSNNRIVWGVAVDDAHILTRGEFGQYAVMVYAKSIDRVLDSLKSGNFYAMHMDGSVINNIQLDGDQLSIDVSSPSDFYFIGAGGAVLKQINGVSKAAYSITGDEGYVRIRIINTASGKYTWTQPIFTSLRAVIPGYTTKSLTENGRLVINTTTEIGE